MNFGIDPTVVYQGNNEQYKGYSILHFAVIQPVPTIISFLLDSKLKYLKPLNVNIEDQNGQNALELAIKM